MRISMIVAKAMNDVIGNGSAIPWKLKADMRYFKAVTVDKAVIMGRKTFESLPKPLPNRLNVVLTRSVASVVFDETNSLVVCVPDVESALTVAAAHLYNHVPESQEILFIGGADIYRLAEPYCNKLYITEVYGEPEGDVKFPIQSFDFKRDWTRTTATSFTADIDNEYPYTFVIYRRDSRIPNNFFNLSHPQ